MIRTVTAIAALLVFSLTLSVNTVSAQWFAQNRFASNHWQDLYQQSRAWRGHVSPHSPLGNSRIAADPARPARAPLDLDYKRVQRRGPDLGLLASYASQLEAIAVHLHDDAHSLSPGYRRSAAIELYVSKIERLQANVREVLHQAASGRISHGVCLSRIRSDVRLVSIWAKRLDRKLDHQSLDGACPRDLRLIRHMRVMIATEMNPLLALLDQELSQRTHHARSFQDHSSHGHRHAPVVSRRPAISFRWGF